MEDMAFGLFIGYLCVMVAFYLAVGVGQILTFIIKLILNRRAAKRLAKSQAYRSLYWFMD
jgi:hypothetical protein